MTLSNTETLIEIFGDLEEMSGIVVCVKEPTFQELLSLKLESVEEVAASTAETETTATETQTHRRWSRFHKWVQSPLPTHSGSIVVFGRKRRRFGFMTVKPRGQVEAWGTPVMKES